MKRRRPGRPTSEVVTRDHILQTALDLLERDGLEALTMRGLARQLGVDAMALYHYFADKDELLREAAAMAYAGLSVRVGMRGSWRQRLESLAVAYVELLARSGELLRYLMRRADAAVTPTRLFESRFQAATSRLRLAPTDRSAAHDAFVDFLHGFSLGVDGTLTTDLRARLRNELGILFAGIAARARS